MALTLLARDETIREMSPHDLDDIMDIERLSFAAPWTRYFFEETLRSPISLSLVMKKGADTIGYIILYSIVDEAHILNVAIHPAFRGKGYAKRLLMEAVDKCRANGIRQFFLEVRESNITAIALYENLGFRQIGTRKRYYPETNEDALVMYLTVNEGDNTHAS